MSCLFPLHQSSDQNYLSISTTGQTVGEKLSRRLSEQSPVFEGLLLCLLNCHYSLRLRGVLCRLGSQSGSGYGEPVGFGWIADRGPCGNISTSRLSARWPRFLWDLSIAANQYLTVCLSSACSKLRRPFLPSFSLTFPPLCFWHFWTSNSSVRGLFSQPWKKRLTPNVLTRVLDRVATRSVTINSFSPCSNGPIYREITSSECGPCCPNGTKNPKLRSSLFLFVPPKWPNVIQEAEVLQLGKFW